MDSNGNIETSKFNNDPTLLKIKEILEIKSQNFLIEKLLECYWKNVGLLNNTDVWKEYLENEKQLFLNNNV